MNEPSTQLMNHDRQDAEARQKFEKALTNLDEEFKTWTDTIHDSERLSEDDFAIYINV